MGYQENTELKYFPIEFSGNYQIDQEAYRQTDLVTTIVLYGQVNSVENHNYKIWLNDGVYYKGKTTCFGL